MNNKLTQCELTTVGIINKENRETEGKEIIPNWTKGKLFYQIFVDRFHKSPNVVNSKILDRNYRNWGEEVCWKPDSGGNYHNNDFFQGNLKGIEEKLDYLSSLGVEVLYLSPINFSNMRYERYAATNHMEIDPDVGDWEALKELCKKAHSQGMHVIVDVAFNHCRNDNPIYLDALNNPNSIYKNWFKRNANGNICCWYGFGDMPEFNQWSEEYQKYVYGENGVISKYVKNGVDGFRLDLAECLEHFFLEGIRTRAKIEGAEFIVGECWNEPNQNILGKGLDSTTYYPLTNAILKFVAYGEEYLARKIWEVVNNYSQEFCDSLLLSLETHDIIRVRTILAKSQHMKRGMVDIWKIDESPTPWHRNENFYTYEFREFEYQNDKFNGNEFELSKKLLKIAAIIQDFLIGNPCQYYGTEAGLYGWKDPFNRKCYPWGNEDQELLKFYQMLGQFRKQFVLVNCNPQVLYIDSDLFIFKRENKENSVFVAVNRSANTRKYTVPEEFKEAFKNKENVFILNEATTEHLLPYSGIVIKK